MNVGRLVVRLDANIENFEANLSEAMGATRRLGQRLTDVGKNLTVGLTLPIAAAGAAAIKLASDAEEAGAKMGSVFGGATDEMNAWIEDMQDTIPATVAELQGMTSGIQDLLVPLGLAPDAALEMTKQVTTLAADLAAFNGIPVAEALAKIRSGMVGQNEPLLDFGVALSAATVEAKALELGLIKEGEALSAAARAQAAFQLTVEGTTAAHGAAASEAGGAAASFAFLVVHAKELATTFGEILLPIVVPMVKSLVDLLKRIRDLSPETQRLIVVVAGVAAAFGPLVVAIGGFMTILPVLTAGVTGLGVVLTALSGPIGLTLAALAAAYIVWEKWGDDITAIVRRVYEAVRTWLVDRFSGIVDSVRGKVEAVTGFFAGMYDAVVGNSYVPDMVKGIKANFARLDSVMVQPAAAAANNVEAMFARMAHRVAERQREVFERARQFEALGGTLDRVTVAARPAAATATADAARPEYNPLRGVMESIVQDLSPMGLALRFVGGALERLWPTIERVLEPITLLGEMVGGLLVPVVELLIPPIKLVAKLMSYLGTAIGWIVRAIGKAVNFLLPGNPANGMVRMGEEMMQSAERMRRDLAESGLAEQAAGAAEKLNTLADAVVNTVAGFKVQQYRFEATQGTSFAGGTATPAGPTDTRPSTPAVNVGGVNITTSGDGRDTYREFYNEFDQRTRGADPDARALFLALPAPV